MQALRSIVLAETLLLILLAPFCAAAQEKSQITSEQVTHAIQEPEKLTIGPDDKAAQVLVENLNVRGEGTFKRESAPQVSRQSSAPVLASADFAGLVEIGDGRKMYVECRGSGSPTVILESGYRNDAEIWSTPLEPGVSTVFAQVAKFTRVCAYDRPGTFLDAGHLGRIPRFPCRALRATSFPIFMHCSRPRMSPDHMSSPRIPLVASLPGCTPAFTRMRLLEWFWLMRYPKT